MKLARITITLLALLCCANLSAYAQEADEAVTTDDAARDDTAKDDVAKDSSEPEEAEGEEDRVDAEDESDEELPASIVDMLTKELEEASGELPVVELNQIDTSVDGSVDGSKCDGKFQGTVRVGLWLAGLSTSFRANVGDTEVSIDDDLDAPDVIAALPIEALFKTDSQEFKIEFVHFSAIGHDDHFGTINGVSVLEDTSASLFTNSLGVEFLQRIFYYDWADLYLAAGLDLLSTNLKINGATPGRSVSIDEIVPIVTVGLGLRVKLKEDLHLYLKSSALDYSQLIGLKSTYFKPDGRYRDSELSVMWVRSDKLSFGAGLRFYDVGVWSAEINNEQRLYGPYGWLNLKF